MLNVIIRILVVLFEIGLDFCEKTKQSTNFDMFQQCGLSSSGDSRSSKLHLK